VCAWPNRVHSLKARHEASRLNVMQSIVHGRGEKGLILSFPGRQERANRVTVDGYTHILGASKSIRILSRERICGRMRSQRERGSRQVAS